MVAGSALNGIVMGGIVAVGVEILGIAMVAVGGPLAGSGVIRCVWQPDRKR